MKVRLPARHQVRLRLTKTIATHYDAWHAAQPGKGHDAKTAEWKVKPLAWRGPR